MNREQRNLMAQFLSIARAEARRRPFDAQRFGRTMQIVTRTVSRKMQCVAPRVGQPELFS